MKRRISIVLVVIFVVVIGAFTIYAKTSDTKSNKEEVKLGFMSNIKELSEISAIMDLVEENFVDSNPDKKITVWEIDNNNKSNKHISSKYLKYESIKLDKSEMAINDIEFSNLTDPNTIHVVDTGGSDDATKILAHLKQVELTGLQYIIPTNEDMDQIDNIITIIDIIRQQDKNCL